MNLIIFILLMAAASWWDIREMRIPNGLTLGGWFLLIILEWFTNPPGVGAFILGGLLFALPLLICALVSNGRLGMGDVKLSLSMGSVLGWIPGWTALLCAASLMFIWAGMVKSRGPFPFAPFLGLGGVAALLLKMTDCFNYFSFP